MEISLKVPSIACEVCGKTITKAVQNQDPNAQVTVDVEEKIVTVTTAITEEIIRQAIIKAGHEIAAP